MPFAPLNGLPVYYKWEDRQQPQTLVFINSLGTDLRIWDGVLHELGNSVNTLRYDKRGHGMSGETPANQVDTLSPGTMTLYANDLTALLDYLGIQRCILVGLSVGGRIAMLVADQQPERIDRLVLCDTAHIIGTRESWNSRIRAAQTVGLARLSGIIMERWFAGAFRRDKSAYVQIYQRMVSGCAPADYVRCCEAIRDADLTAVAQRLRQPALCVVGSEDVATPPAVVESLAQMIPDARYELMAGSGHLPCVDNPAGLTKLITEFLNG